MNSLLSVIRRTAQTPGNLEDVLAELEKYGCPRVCKLDGYGWYAAVKMNVQAVGASFEVSSELKHPTPLSAARECLERAQAAAKKGGAL